METHTASLAFGKVNPLLQVDSLKKGPVEWSFDVAFIFAWTSFRKTVEVSVI